MRIRNLLAVFVLGLCLSVSACFFSTPGAYVGVTQVTHGGGSGGGTWVEKVYLEEPPMEPDPFAGLKAFLEALYNIILQGAQSFPMTFNTEFTGFADGSRVTRACLLYLNREGYWVILQDIKNPSWEVVSNTGQGRALFGKMSVPSSCGYHFGEVLALRTYYKSATQETFNLNQALKTKVTDLSALENVIFIFVRDNTTPGVR